MSAISVWRSKYWKTQIFLLGSFILKTIAITERLQPDAFQLAQRFLFFVAI